MPRKAVVLRRVSLTLAFLAIAAVFALVVVVLVTARE